MGKKDKGLILIFLCSLAYIAVFTYLNILRYRAFFSYEWEDLATHNQLLWNTAHGNFFYNSIGISGYYFSYHFQPVILFQGLFYRIWPHIYNFYFMTSAALGIGAVPLYLTAQKILKNRAAAFILSLSYLLYSPVHNINFCDGDPVLLTIPVFFLLLFYLEKNEYRFTNRGLIITLALILSALMCKEDVIFTVAFFGLYLALRKKLKYASACFAAGGVWFLISIPVTTLWLNKGLSLARCVSYGSFGDLLSAPFMSPVTFVSTLFSSDHVQYLLKIFTPLLFLPLFSLMSISAVFPVMELLIGRGVIKYSQVYFISPAIPFLFVGALYTIRKLSSFIHVRLASKIDINKITIVISLAVLVFNAYNLFQDNILGHVRAGKTLYDKRFINAKNIFDPVFYKMDDEDRLAWSFISMIPSDASVSASGDLLPALSGRKRLLELFNRDYDYLDAEYVLFHTKYMGFGAGDYCRWSSGSLVSLIEEMKANPKWLKIREEGSFILFRRR